MNYNGQFKIRYLAYISREGANSHTNSVIYMHVLVHVFQISIHLPCVVNIGRPQFHWRKKRTCRTGIMSYTSLIIKVIQLNINNK